MRMISRMSIGLAAAVSLLLSTAALAQKVTYDYRSRETIARLKTFTFKESPPADNITEKTTAYDSPFVAERTRDAIAVQLEHRGIVRNEQAPDAYVVFRRTYRAEYTFYNPYGWAPYPWWGPYDWGWGPYGWWGLGYTYGAGTWDAWGPWYTQETIVGTLTVDLEDPETGELIWRGIGKKTVDPWEKPAKRAKHVNEEVDKIFRNFPR